MAKKYYAIAGLTVAVQDGSGLQYLLTDHLGSIVAVTDASGTLTSQQRYLPFGQVRSDVGSIAETDLAYTGQRAVDGLGLLDYHARFYDSSIGRFISPDSIVSDPANPQALNRYAYVNNSPITYNDPSGHMFPTEPGYVNPNGGCGNPGQISCLGNSGVDNGDNGGEDDNDGSDNGDKCTRSGGCDTNGDGVPDVPDPYAPPVTLGTTSDPKCLPGDLVECFYRRGRIPTGDWDISDEELNSLMLAVYYDIAKRPVSLSDFDDRKIYDTPFWDGFSADTGSICARGSCYARTDVNYFAQGMYSAKYEGRAGGLTVMNIWKLQYHHLASADAMTWFNKGFNFYETASFAPNP